MSNGSIFAAIAVCALCTFALRAAPFALFSGRRRMPPFLQKLAGKMPAAIIAVLVVYCLKGLPSLNLSQTAVTLVCVACVVGLHLWKKNTLLSIAGGTVLYMTLLHFV